LKAYILYHAFIHNDHVSEFIPEQAIDASSATSSTEVAKESQKWSMRKLMDYWRRIDERQRKYEGEKGNPLDSLLSSEAPEKLHTWTDGNTNPLDLKAISNLISTKESDLASERPKFLSLSNMHESNLLRQQIAKAAAASSERDTSSPNSPKEKADLSNNEQNEATVTLESIAVAREQRPALADLSWNQGEQQQTTPPRTIPTSKQSHVGSADVPRGAVHEPYGSLQSDFSGLSSVTGATSCYYTSAMTTSELQNDESSSMKNEGDDTGESTGSESCSSDSSDDDQDSRASPAEVSSKPSDLQSYDDNSLAFTGHAAEEGRRFMMEELGLSGDDQTIVVVSYSHWHQCS
jgi:hypothetical protein